MVRLFDGFLPAGRQGLLGGMHNNNQTIWQFNHYQFSHRSNPTFAMNIFMASPNTIIYPLRLHPTQDLRSYIEAFAREKDIKAGFIITAIGSLNGYHLRFANKQQGSSASGYFEILSLNGTISTNGVHLHICLADSNGKTIGGHLLEGNHIYTTAEIVIGESTQHIFTRKIDPKTGFNELEMGNR